MNHHEVHVEPIAKDIPVKEEDEQPVVHEASHHEVEVREEEALIVLEEAQPEEEEK